MKGWFWVRGFPPLRPTTPTTKTCHWGPGNSQGGGTGHFGFSAAAAGVLRLHRNVGDARGTENATVALDLFGRTHGLGVVVGEFDCRAALHFRKFAHQADRVEAL